MGLLVGGAVLVYTAGFLLWFSATPLGLHPALDGREMLVLAGAIADGSLVPEPFYRAPLYPALLALLLEAGVPEGDLAFAARMLNGALHLASTALVWRLARRLWAGTGPAALAAGLYGLNPVALHFAADPLDITLAITLLLVGCDAALRATRPTGDFAAGIAFALATLVRPQLLPLVIAWWAWRLPSVHDGATAGRYGALVLLPVLLVFGTMGTVNVALSGEFRVLPWQGAFNLWAANRPGANGRYFEQSAPLAVYDEGVNPARLDAERRYRELAPGQPTDVATTTHFWQARLFEELRAAPLAWLRLLAAKAWYLLNNFEQYNNKTYHLHKQLSPWLAPNPLCWTVVLGLAVFALAALPDRPGVRLLAYLALAYAAGLLMSYVSDRFRLPLVAFGAVLAGGAVPALASAGRVRALALAGVVTVTSLVPLPVADATRTYVQDYLQLSRAALDSGDSATASSYAEHALVEQPDVAAALELRCVAQFHQWLAGAQTTTALRRVAAHCRAASTHAPTARRVMALVDWREGRDAAALSAFQALAADGPERAPAQAALIMLDAGARAAAARDCAKAGCADVVLLALAVHGQTQAREKLATRLPPALIERQAAEIVRTYSRD